MTAPIAEMPIDLPCHQCGYDLRAHPPDGKCPECGAAVAESRRLAAIPLRPAWRDSDPRWRRRMLAGTWVLVLLPLINVLMRFEWASHVSVPTLFDCRGDVTLNDTFFANPYLYQPLIFSIGVALLFSKERGRRRNRLDWTRRWGVICTYVAFLLTAAATLFISALVLAGIAAVFQSMPLKYQPSATQFFVNVSTNYLRYGACPRSASDIVLIGFSLITIPLACIALFDALRSTGLKRLAAIPLTPLALFSLLHLVQACLFYLGFSNVTLTQAYGYGTYFRPDLLVSGIAVFPDLLSMPEPNAFLIEAAKWCIFLGIAAWLSFAQLAAWWQRKKATTA